MFFFLGPEEFRKREVMEQHLRKHQLGLQQLQSYHAASANWSEIQDLLLTPPLFGDIPPVLISDVQLLAAKEQKRLAALCAAYRKTQNSFLFLFSTDYKAPATLAKVLPKSEQRVFWELSEGDKKKHIAEYVRKNKREIDPAAIEILLERVSGDVITLERTLDTVFLYLGKPENATHISEELLTQIFTQSRDTSIYELFHYMVLRDLGRSLQAVENLLLQGTGKAVSLLLQLLYHWDKLLQIKERMRFDPFEDVCATEYIRTKALRADMRCGADNYSLRELRQIQQINQEYSLHLKLGTGIQDLLLQHYVYRVLIMPVLDLPTAS